MDLEQQLREALIPCRPTPSVRAAVLARVASARSARDTRHRFSRPILFGTVVIATMAAAAMLAARLQVKAAPSINATLPAAASVAGPAAVTHASPPLDQAQPAPPVRAKSEPGQAISAVKPFTVLVLPLQDNSTDADGKSAVNSFYFTLLDGLRAVPGLKLVAPDPAGSAVTAPPDFQLTIRGAGPLPGNKFRIDLRADAGRRRQPFRITGDIAPPCAGTGAPDCGDPASIAAFQLLLLRDGVFPTDVSLPRELERRLLNPVWSLDQRRAALRDPAAIRTAIDLATTAAGPADRAQVWRNLRGVHQTEFIRPLIDSLRQDPAANVRAEAAATLAVNFGSDPGARAALEATVHEDPRALVRALAQRGLSGEAVWNEYVVTSLKDSTLPAAGRIEALLYATQAGQDPLRYLLGDDEAMRALAVVLSTGQTSALSLVNRLGSIDDPAITDMLLATLVNSEEPDARRIIVNQIVGHATEPAVQAVLQKISAEDHDPQLRETAARALRAVAVPASQ